MKTSFLIATAFSIGAITNVQSSIGATISSDLTSSVSSSSNSNSEVTFTGNSGRQKINNDVVEVRDGTLEVNGVSFGKVSDKSVIKYIVRGNRKSVYVDGELRKPAR